MGLGFALVGFRGSRAPELEGFLKLGFARARLPDLRPTQAMLLLRSGGWAKHAACAESMTAGSKEVLLRHWWRGGTGRAWKSTILKL